MKIVNGTLRIYIEEKADSLLDILCLSLRKDFSIQIAVESTTEGFPQILYKSLGDL